MQRKAILEQDVNFLAKFLTFARSHRLRIGGNRESVMRDALRVRRVTPSTGSNGWIVLKKSDACCGKKY